MQSYSAKTRPMFNESQLGIQFSYGSSREHQRNTYLDIIIWNS
jgi:hypothetical protein